MKTVLLPTDFSTNAEVALEFAVELSLRLDADLVIFHSFHSYYAGPNVVAVPENELRNEDLNKLLAVKDLAIQKAGGRELRVVVESRPGMAADAIVDYATELGTELIVMGTQGASGLEEVLLGSVTSNVITRSRVPVLVVPKKAVWQLPTKFAFALDFEDENKFLTQQLIAFASAFEAQITCVHVYGKEEEIQTLSEEAFCMRFPKLAEYPHRDFQPEIADSVEEGLEAMVERDQPDWLAVFTHHRSFWGRLFHASLTKHLACQTKIPLLVIQE